MAEMQGLLERLEKAVIRLESVLSDPCRAALMENVTVNGVSEGVAPCVEAFDLLLRGAVAEYVKKSKIIGGDAEMHAENKLFH